MDYLKVAAAKPSLKVADIGYNLREIVNLIRSMEAEGIRLAVFPELCITGYTSADLFLTGDLLQKSLTGLEALATELEGKEIAIAVGLPLSVQGRLFNCAAVLKGGRVLGMVPKRSIPNYSEFYESRWFAGARDSMTRHVDLPFQKEIPFGSLVFDCGDYTFGVEVCEDLFAPISPSSYLSLQGAEIILNLSASNELVGKSSYRKDLVRMQGSKNIGAYVYSSCGVEESTTDVVFGGHLMVSEYGTMLAENERFMIGSETISAYVDLSRIRGERIKNSSFREAEIPQTFIAERVKFTQGRPIPLGFDRFIDPHPFVPSNEEEKRMRCEEILSIQSHGLVKRLVHTGARKAIVGISGGLDSTLALLVMVKAMNVMEKPLSDIITITMPGFGTSDRTYQNAVELCRELGTTFREIDIREACLLHFKDIGHDPSVHDVTYENVQARERTQILMDIANKEYGILVGTGDLSELAMGWCTYNGDQMSMYGVNSSIPKTLVRYLVRYAAEHEFSHRISEILLDILDTPVSPELLPKSENGEISQKTEDIIGPYELHDFFLYHLMRYGATVDKILFMAEHAFSGTYGRDEIRKWLKFFLKRFFTQQFKRSAMPDGPKVGTIALSPRGDLRMPSDASFATFIKELDEEL